MTSRKLGRKLSEMTSQKDVGVGRHSGIRNVLFVLFSDMLVHLKIDAMKWSHLMNNYIKKQAPHFQNRRDMTSIRGNLNKEFTRGNMTWKVFNKAMMFLGVVRFRITIDAQYENGRVSSHTCLVSFNSVEPYLNSDDPTPDHENNDDTAPQTVFSTNAVEKDHEKAGE